MLIVLARGTVHADKRDDFIAAAKACTEATRQEQGCLTYDFFQSVTDPNRFQSVETWESQEAIDAHFRAPHLAAFFEAVGPCFAEPPIIEEIRPERVTRRS